MLFSLNDELRSDVVIDNFAQNREIVQDIQEPHENQCYSVTSFMSNHGTLQPSVAQKKKHNGENYEGNAESVEKLT